MYFKKIFLPGATFSAGIALTSIAIAFILLFSCCKDKTFEKRTFTANVPLYMSFDELRTAAINSETSKTLTNPGKIYIKDNFLFINDKNKGIHIIDNTNPQSPQNIAYINIPGNSEIAVKENTLYANSFIDLVAIDITDPQTIKISARINDVFPVTLPETGNNYPIYKIEKDKGVVVGWQVRKVSEVMEQEGGTYYPLGGNYLTYDMSTAGNNFSGNEGVSSAGIGGSMAGFTVTGNYLYAISGLTLKVFEISNASNPQRGNSISLNNIPETLFIYGSKLFIGTTTGMLVYDISTPHLPQYLSLFAHARSCDPVVVSGNYAYVTLRGGNSCGGFSNQLDVIDISNIENPTLIKSYSMTEPYGLGIDNSTLFVCDGNAGLKVYDASDPNTIDQHCWRTIPTSMPMMLFPKAAFYFSLVRADYPNMIILIFQQ